MNRDSLRRSLVLGFAILTTVAVAFAAAPQKPSAAVANATSESFDSKIAPLLASRCLGCHNASDKKGGLNLASAAAARAGGESGPAFEPSHPETSNLWSRVADDEMPPNKPLAAEEKELLRRWIADGARWGTDPVDLFRYSSEQRAGLDWWSLQPLSKPSVPSVGKSQWARNEIDHFILAKLQANGLEPAPELQPRLLIRKLYFDLTGLPPTPEEMQSWTKRLKPGEGKIDEVAYRELVDHLLESPHYGERWARHWLDVVRYGESQGYERNRIRDNAWRYRDWVIGAFNRDMPYDEFVRQQIAGDALRPGDLDALIATGYHVCGAWDQVGHLEGSAEMRKAVRQDHLEDLVATLGQTFLGLTLQCARCHDHKFDPISQREYYQIAATLAGVNQEEEERRQITAKPADETYKQWQNAIQAKRDELALFENAIRKQYGKTGGGGGGGKPIEGLQALYRPSSPGDKVLYDLSEMEAPVDLSSGARPPYSSVGPASKLIGAVKTSAELTVEAWITPAKVDQKGPARIVTLSLDSGQRNFTLGQDGDRFDVRLRTTKTDQNGIPSLSTSAGKAIAKRTHVVFTFDRKGVGRLYVDGAQNSEKKGGGDLSNWNDEFRLALGDELTGDRRWEGQFHCVALYSKALSAEQIARNFQTESRDLRAAEPIAELIAKAPAKEQARYASLQQEVARIQQAEPAAPFSGVAHVIIPRQPPVFHVLDRGDYRKPLDIVAPAGLRAISSTGLGADFGLKPDAPEADRRVKLAAWLTDSRNPIAARVMVNRVWHHHFGQGIVDTPSDFGFAGGRPTHPELLDWLAARFIENGWKIKDLHRSIVTSAAYRQASNISNQRAQSVDADNRLLWRGSRRRLEGEAVRDAVLAVSGALNRKLGGPSYRDMKVDQGRMGKNAEFTDPTEEFSDEANRRTIYRLWARAGNNPVLESLDCPDPSVTAPRRMQTITPVQALSLLNSRFMEQCAQRLADSVQRDAGADVDRQIERAYAKTLCRPPESRERELARKFVSQRGLAALCLVLFNTNEFLFVE